MRNFIFSVLSFIVLSAQSQSSADAAVQISAVVQNSPPQITLSWIGNASTTQYTIWRKLKSATSWGGILASLTGTTTQYVDNTVSVGVSYEYRIIRSGSGYSGYGYINSGIRVPEVDYRGKVILIVDSTVISSLAAGLKRLITDIEGDGWDVVRHDVLRTGSVYHVKSLIVNDYKADSLNTRAVFLVGHVPVPYSGNLNPDGHPDHLGAWPADVYYGDMDGLWTDVSVTSTTNSPVRTQNIPGDGKFDQSIVPGDVELQVGRVDFNDLPLFPSSELQLLQNYLDKDHEYRKMIYVPLKRAVVDDNFGYFSGEAFAASGYKNFGPLVGTASVTSADYFTSMSAGSYQWSYGCGGGTYVSAGGVGATSNFTSSSLQGVFSMLFGSYFGDWDCQNNFLRAPLAQGKILTNVWSGRPHYQFHHMGMGENIGFSLITTQNNPGGLYFANPFGITGKWIHNALMGDPTLRTDLVPPVSNIVATKSGYDCFITWSASTETNIVGYNLYTKNDSNKTYTKLNATPIAATSYTDPCLRYPGIYSYMVRVLKLEVTPSGSYYNMSEGIADTALNKINIASIAAFTTSIIGNTVTMVNTSTVPATYYWDFGNGDTGAFANASVTYTANGTYTIMLVATHPCYTDTSYQVVTITEVGLRQFENAFEFNIHPNPSHGIVKIELPVYGASLFIYNSEGKLVHLKHNLKKEEEIDLSAFDKGLYMIQLINKEERVSRKLVIE